MPHISFSELKNWDKCPHYHKLVNIDKIKVFAGNAYTAFGTAMHTVCENKLLDNGINEPLSMTESINKLENYLIENPKDFQTLKMLGLAQVNTGNIDKSIESFEKAFLINPNDIDLLLQYASAIAANQDGKFYGKSKILIEKALSLDPQSIQVLYFAGIVAAHQTDLDQARDYWQKALYLMPESHPDRNIIEEALDTILNLQVK
jgi:cytochrome c-type biogenesis protein CcmH